MKIIQPGIYDDERGGLYVDLAELLTANGYEDTPHNRAVLTHEAQTIARRIGARFTVDVYGSLDDLPPVE